MELLKKAWPEWEVSKELGAGAFGKVYDIKKTDIGGEFHAALKILSIPKDENEVSELLSEGMDYNGATAYYRSVVEEIAGEFALMERLKGNSNIVSYEDHKVIPRENSVGWDILIRMELLTPLNSYILNHAFTEQEVVKLGIDICKALELCQKQNIIHRDIKPENIFVSDFGDFKLGDFGIARTAEKTTMGMSRKGTFSYMAPEVYAGRPYNATVDLYSLGIVLYRLLNDNRTPFLPTAPNPITYADKENAQVRRLSGEVLPAPAHASAALYNIISRACAFNPAERFSNASEMRSALEMVQSVLTPAQNTFSGAPTQMPNVNSHETIQIFNQNPVDFQSTVLMENAYAQPVQQMQAQPTPQVMPQVQPAPQMMQQPVMNQQMQPQYQQAQTMQQSEKAPKKSPLKFILIGAGALLVGILAIVLVLNLGKSNNNSKASGDKHIKDSEEYFGDAVSSDEFEAAKGAGTALGVKFTPEMFWGTFHAIDPGMEASVDPHGTGNFWDYVGGVTIQRPNYKGVMEDYEISVLPVKITSGRVFESDYPIPDPYSNNPDVGLNIYQYPDSEQREQWRKDFVATYGEEGITYYTNFMNLFDMTFTEVMLCDKNSSLYYVSGMLVVDGSTLKIVEPMIDHKTYEVTEGETLVSYEAKFEGRNLVLSAGKKEVVYQPKEWSYDHKERDLLISCTGYANDMSHAYMDISEIAYYGKWDETDDFYVRFINGDSAIDPKAEFNEDGTFTISWEEAYRRYNGKSERTPESVSISGEYIWNGDFGLILKIDGQIYRYQKTYWEYVDSIVEDVPSNVSEGDVAAIVATQQDILAELLEALKAAGIDATVDEKGRVNMDTNILFAVDSDTISADGQVMLDQFLKVYAEVIVPYMEQGVISNVKVEGHTDTDGTYEYNQDLSERRAAAVADYCREVQPELGAIMTSEGFSFSDPIFDENGDVDKAASRRVVFKFILNT